MRSTELHGVICPVITPFDEVGRVDEFSLLQVVDFLLDHGIDGLMVGGTTGEGMSLSLSERMSICEAVVQHVDGRVPVIVHTGCVTTKETVSLTQHAASVGSCAASIIVPYFYTFDDDSLYQHFVAVAEATPDLPLLIYTFPGNAKNDVSPTLLGRLLDATDNIIGLKSSNPDLQSFQQYIRVGGPDFTAICGADGLMLPALHIGSHGQISGNANVYPEALKALYTSFRAGDTERSRKLQQTLDHIRAILANGLHVAYFKAGLRLRGIPAGYVRSPMRELSRAELNLLEMQMNQIDPKEWQ